MSLSKHRAPGSSRLWIPSLLGIGVGVAAAAVVGYAITGPHARSPFPPQQWSEAVDELGAVRDFRAVLKEVAERGLDPSLRPQLWPLLLEVYSPHSTLADRQAQHATLTQVYRQYLNMCEDLESQWLMARESAPSEPHPQASAAPSTSSATPPPGGLSRAGSGMGGEPGGSSDMSSSSRLGVAPPVAEFHEAHRLIVTDALRTDFRLAPAGSSGSWLPTQFLPFSSSSKGSLSSDGRSHSGLASHFIGGWTSTVAAVQLEQASHLDATTKHYIERLVPLLCAYAVHDPETGYCQGMADLAAPFLVLLEDDALAFHCFCKLMARVRPNFAVDATGIFLQLKALSAILQRCDPPLYHRLRHLGVAECHFAYRMIVVLMKRELPAHQALLLWEMVWADELLQRLAAGDGEPSLPLSPLGAQPPPPSLVRQDSFLGGGSEAQGLFMYFVAAVISSQRRRILDDCHDADNVLSLFNHHQDTIRTHLWQCLKKARQFRALALSGHLKQT